MKNKLKSVLEFFKTRRKTSVVILGFIIAVLFTVFGGGSTTEVTIIPVEKGELKQTVLATGQVTSTTDLALSFSQAGIISRLPVSVGSKVSRGQILASIENGDEHAALKTAQAKLSKVLEGSSSQEIAVAQAALDSAKASLENTKLTQDTLVANAKRDLLNTDLTPVLNQGTSTTPPTVTGIYTSNEEGEYNIVPQSSGGTAYFTFTGLESGTGTISTTTPVALGTKGLYIQFPANYTSGVGNTWTVALPNKKSANYLADYNALQNALKNRDSAISQAETRVVEAQANLDLKKAPARNSDVEAAEAEVEQRQATYAKTLLIAPASGTITKVDTKIGERADAAKQIITLQNISDLYVEANINETNIARINLGQKVSMTLDAFGPEVFFTGEVIHIDPSATTEDGVVNYIIKTSITDPNGLYTVRPGMNANLVITAWEYSDVLSVPKAAVFTEDDGSHYVNMLVDAKKNKTVKQPVTIGNIGDGNMVLVTSGLNEGDSVTLKK